MHQHICSIILNQEFKILITIYYIFFQCKNHDTNVYSLKLTFFFWRLALVLAVDLEVLDVDLAVGLAPASQHRQRLWAVRRPFQQPRAPWCPGVEQEDGFSWMFLDDDPKRPDLGSVNVAYVSNCVLPLVNPYLWCAVISKSLLSLFSHSLAEDQDFVLQLNKLTQV